MPGVACFQKMAIVLSPAVLFFGPDEVSQLASKSKSIHVIQRLWIMTSALVFSNCPLGRKTAHDSRRANGNGRGGRWLGDQLVDNIPVNIGKTKIAARMPKSQPGVIETKKLEDCGVQIVDVHRIFHRLETEIVGGAMDIATANTPAGQPHREAVVIMVAAIDLSSI